MATYFPPRIAKNDIELLSLIADYKYIDLIFIEKYCYQGFKSSWIRKRLRQLAEHGYVIPIKSFIPGEYT